MYIDCSFNFSYYNSAFFHQNWTLFLFSFFMQVFKFVLFCCYKTWFKFVLPALVLNFRKFCLVLFSTACNINQRMVADWLFVSSIVSMALMSSRDWFLNIVVVNSFPRWFFDNLNEIKNCDGFKPFIINFSVFCSFS